MKTAQTEWFDFLGNIYKNGKYCKVHGLEVKEFRDTKFNISMNYPTIRYNKRKIGEKFRYAEPYWILSGDNRLSSIRRYAPAFANYSDDDVFMAGAYGPPIIDQIPYVLSCIGYDVFTRQALLTIWRPRPAISKDIPCTISMQFQIRDNIIHTTVYMRSSDLWLGLPYDVFTFTMISAYIGLLLRKQNALVFGLGELTIFSGNSHIYKTDFKKVEELLKATDLVELSDPQEPIINLNAWKDQEDLMNWLHSNRDGSTE